MSHPTRQHVVGWAWASLVANVVIVFTGGLVRLTSSGLGCPTWPRCTASSFVPHRALGIHGVIEFSNRMLTYALVAVAVGTLLAVWRCAETRRERSLAVLLAAGIPLQGVIGGITVLTDLNPWLVSLHLVTSMVLVAGSVILMSRVAQWRTADAGRPALGIVRALAVVAAVVVYLGTMVTGSGPHAGDASSPRNGLDSMSLSEWHGGAVAALVMLTLAAVVLLKGTPAARWAWALLAVELVQAAIGVAQYELGLPIWLVAAHLVGAAILVAVTTALVTGTSRQGTI